MDSIQNHTHSHALPAHTVPPSALCPLPPALCPLLLTHRQALTNWSHSSAVASKPLARCDHSREEESERETDPSTA